MASPDELTRSANANLTETTGRTLDEWIAIARQAPDRSYSRITSWLREEHDLRHGHANLLAIQVLAPGTASVADALDNMHRLDSQYSGKEHLQPVYDRLIEIAIGFTDDVDVITKRNYVSLRRRKQFAIIKPSTKTRLDLGLCMRGVEAAGRLEPSGSFSSMASHRVRITSLDEVDDEVVLWLRLAHHLAGPV